LKDEGQTTRNKMKGQNEIRTNKRLRKKREK
jgi:hypothetical protein